MPKTEKQIKDIQARIDEAQRNSNEVNTKQKQIAQLDQVDSIKLFDSGKMITGLKKGDALFDRLIADLKAQYRDEIQTLIIAADNSAKGI